MARRAPLVAGVLVVFGVLAVATVRELVLGARAVDEADAALEIGDAKRAITAARAAAEAVAPASPYPLRGYERLEGIAKDAESHGDTQTAASAWLAMRAAASATRGPFVRTDAWQALADEGIVRVGAAKPPPAAPVGSSDTAARVRPDVAPSEEALVASLERNDTPDTWTFALLAAGAAGFFGGIGRLAWLAGEKLDTKRARWPAIAAACGLVLYAVACLKA